MSQLANVSTADRTEQQLSADHRFAIAAVLVATTFALIAAQLVFVDIHPGVLDAAANTAAFGLIGP
jgi:hypothetical protein